MSKKKRWVVSFRATAIAANEFDAIKEVREKVARHEAIPYVECYGEATPEDLEEEKK